MFKEFKHYHKSVHFYVRVFLTGEDVSTVSSDVILVVQHLYGRQEGGVHVHIECYLR